MFGFSDETYIDVASGKGGSGSVSFRREKYVPKGGPDGGDGGDGGSVVFVVRNNLRTLQHLKTQRTFRAQNGEPGRGSRRHGGDGGDIIIPVPPGTLIKDTDTGQIIKDLTDSEEWIFLQGGKGGKGNWHFRTSRRQAPRFAQPGIDGIEMRIHVELRIIADIGFVGFPNAGKSSLLNYLTNANSKVADYPFTTKIPHLGVFTYDDRDIVLADIPGIIEGASHGAGLGYKFLRHISRTEVLAFLIDSTSDDFEETFDALMHELSTYGSGLADKKRVVIASKIDLPEAEAHLELLKKRIPNETVIPISIFTGDGIRELRQNFRSMLSDNQELVEDPWSRGVSEDGCCRKYCRGCCRKYCRGYCRERVAMLQKTALLGGSFNPVHNGHLHLLREVLFLTDYFRVILLPLNRPSHKEEEIRIAPEKRIDMLHLAIDSLNMNLQNKEILIDTCEIDRGGDTYTYDSVHGIYQRYEVEGRLGVIIGDDLLEGLPTWYRWKELRELVTFLVARRESSGTDSFVIPQDCTLEILENRQLEVSSSLIRGRISADLPVSHLVPEGVAAYMDAHGLYRL